MIMSNKGKYRNRSRVFWRWLFRAPFLVPAVMCFLVALGVKGVPSHYSAHAGPGVVLVFVTERDEVKLMMLESYDPVLTLTTVNTLFEMSGCQEQNSVQRVHRPWIRWREPTNLAGITAITVVRFCPELIFGLVGVLFTIVLGRTPFVRYLREHRGLCTACAYDIRYSPSNVCSECGAPCKK